MTERIAVVGNGAIGVFATCMLALSGKEVTLIGRPGSQSIKAIKASGGITFNVCVQRTRSI
jgi:ketopantoate reductase